MPYYRIIESPHFVLKNPTAMEQAREELLNEYRGFLVSLISALREGSALTFVIRSLPPEKPHRNGSNSGAGVEFGYHLDKEQPDLEAFRRTLRYLRVVRVAREEEQALEADTLPLLPPVQRRVRLVSVGDVTRTQAEELLEPGMKPYADYDLDVREGGVLGLFAGPLLLKLREKMRDYIGGGARLAPIPYSVTLLQGNAHWRHLCAALMQTEGRVEICCRPFKPRQGDIDYAILCQQYYIGTNVSEVAKEDVENNTRLLRAISSDVPLYTLDFTFRGQSEHIVQAFLQDTDPEAFETGHSDFRRKLDYSKKLWLERNPDSRASNPAEWQGEPFASDSERSDTDTWGRSASGRQAEPARKPSVLENVFTRNKPENPFAAGPARMKEEAPVKTPPDWNIVGNYERYFETEEICSLLLVPPFSLNHALPGISQFVPRPFLEPFLPEEEKTDAVFEVGEHPIHLGALEDGRTLRLPSQRLTSHLFVTGASGAGKSNTMMGIVEQLDAEGIPTLLLDPAKRDFEPLLEKLNRINDRPARDRIFDFDSGQSWLRFNPFLPAPNIKLYSHCVILAKSLSMLFPTNAVGYEMIMGIVKSLYWNKLRHYGRLYRKDDPRLGVPGNERETAWRRAHYEQLNTEIFVNLRGDLLLQNPHYAPTFAELLERGLETMQQRVASSPQSQYYREALEYFQRRWEGLEQSALRVMLTPRAPYRRIEQTGLFDQTSLIEFGSWFDADEANAAIALIFSMLYEHQFSAYQDAVAHGRPACLRAALLDEAHRIVPAQQEGSDARLISSGREVANLFGKMVAECRAMGQILIFGEQSASKIDPNVLINTSSKIVHRVVYGKDKEFLGSALSLSPEEQDFLAYLPTGQALAFTPDVYQPLAVQFPPWKRDNAS